MGNKVFYKTTIFIDEQEVTIMPTETFDCLIIECREMDGVTHSPRIYLNEDEMELLIVKMKDMMQYIKPSSKP